MNSELIKKGSFFKTDQNGTIKNSPILNDYFDVSITDKLKNLENDFNTNYQNIKQMMEQNIKLIKSMEKKMDDKLSIFEDRIDKLEHKINNMSNINLSLPVSVSTADALDQLSNLKISKII